MNVLKPHLQTTIKTLLDRGIGQREIERKIGVDRKTIRRYERIYDLVDDEGNDPPKSPTPATGFCDESGQNPPPWPPASGGKIPKYAVSACEPHREWIEEQLRLGRNATAIYQDLVERFGFTHRYNSVKRFVRGLKKKDPQQYDRLEFLPGEEAQVDYGKGAPCLQANGRYRRPRLFVMSLKYSGRAFRKVVWKSSKETWCRLHEEAFRYFGGCVQYVCLDNLKEGVIKPDIYEPELNVLYAAMLSHYGVIADTARVRDANRKGTVENAVKYTQDTALKGRRFESIEAQNEWLMRWEERWAARRIHGRAKRQVEEMYQEEKPCLMPLPLSPFAYFRQVTRTVYDDGTVQVDNSYYAARPAPLYSSVVVRVYDKDIEILDPRRMEVIRRHEKGKRPGSLKMEPSERIFNPSRQTDRLLAQAEIIGPHTFSLCEQWFREEGRSGQRRMYGLVNLVRHYPAGYVEKAAEVAMANGLKSSRALKRMVESMVAEEDERKTEPSGLTQDHPLIRPAEDYAAFWQQHAAGEVSPGKSNSTESCDSKTISLAEVWGQANWLRVIEVFGLEVDNGRCRHRDDELWIKSPFTQEEHASMHVSLSENIFKDFSSGKGGGIMQFCREMLLLQGREMTMLDVARWMVEERISKVSDPKIRPVPKKHSGSKAEGKTNRAINIDLRRYLRPDHPELTRRGITASTCRYLGCGFLPGRSWAKTASPLNSRVVFQIRGVSENGDGFKPVILSHAGRALNREQEARDGKYWCYPFHKGLELYNQDLILLDEEAWRQASMFGLIVAEGFFDVAKLVESGCRNAVALMGSAMSEEQIERLVWMHEKVRFPRIVLFLDRDQAGTKAAKQIHEQLSGRGFSVDLFDWERFLPVGGEQDGAIQDPAEMTVAQIQTLRRQGIV
jgi:transposase/5S rRNA maturation endonuclease (ribonuclease M5)